MCPPDTDRLAGALRALRASVGQILLQMDEICDLVDSIPAPRHDSTFELMTEPTPLQRRAFELLEVSECARYSGP